MNRAEARDVQGRKRSVRDEVPAEVDPEAVGAIRQLAEQPAQPPDGPSSEDAGLSGPWPSPGVDIKPALAVARTVAKMLGDQVDSAAVRANGLEKQTLAATKLKKLRSIGYLTRVVLYDTEIRLGGRTVPLVPEMHSSAMNQGNRQVVQGWVLRNTNDRREMMLEVVWPGGFEVVTWERNDKRLTGSAVLPAEVHAMAAAINQAAAEVVQTQRAKEAAQRRAKGDLAHHLEESISEIETSCRDAEVQVDLVSDLFAGRQDHPGFQSERSVRKQVSSELDACATAIGVLTEALDRAHSFESTARGRLDDLSHASEPVEGARHAAPTPQPPEAPFPSAPSPATVGEPDALTVLERLAALAERGLLTPEEYAAKKAEILRRL